MHPFYGAAQRLAQPGSPWAGVIPMAAYLAFWAAAAVVARRELEARFPRQSGDRGEEAEAILRTRYARGEIDEAEYRRMRVVLRER